MNPRRVNEARKPKKADPWPIIPTADRRPLGWLFAGRVGK